MSGSTNRIKERTAGRQTFLDACLTYICGQECVRGRTLWQEVFAEDSVLFTDYYFAVKAPENEGFFIEGKEGLRAMLFLTPEKVRVYEKKVQSAYIVGVATKEPFRHRGYMAGMLKESFRLMYGRKMPFVFLMPALAAIYEPFGFRFIYDRPLWDAESLQKEKLRPLGQEQIGQIAAFSQRLLEQSAAVYICRDAAYDKVMLAELAAQNGQAFGYYVSEGKNDRLAGLCLYTCEEEVPDIQEVLALQEDEKSFIQRLEEKRPCIMARIVHIESMLALLQTAALSEAFSFVLHVEDGQIAENNGLFLCHADRNGCCVKRTDDQTLVEKYPFWQGSIAGLTEQIFGYADRQSESEIFGRLRLLSPVWINEIV